jgi:hypothetical protein
MSTGHSVEKEENIMVKQLFLTFMLVIFLFKPIIQSEKVLPPG